MPRVARAAVVAIVIQASSLAIAIAFGLAVLLGGASAEGVGTSHNQTNPEDAKARFALAPLIRSR